MLQTEEKGKDLTVDELQREQTRESRDQNRKQAIGQAHEARHPRKLSLQTLDT